MLSSNGSIGNLLFDSDKHFEFYSCNYMRYEIHKHWDRLKEISKLTDDQLEISYIQVLSKINFINEDLIGEEIWLAAESLTKGIDVDDTDFVAMTLFLKGYLWTGDKALYKGLKKLHFKRALNTTDLSELRLSRM